MSEIPQMTTKEQVDLICDTDAKFKTALDIMIAIIGDFPIEAANGILAGYWPRCSLKQQACICAICAGKEIKDNG